MSKSIKITAVFIFILIAIYIVFIKCTNYNNLFVEKIFTPLEKRGEIPKLDRSKDLKGSVTNNYGVRDDIYQWILDKKLDEPKTRALIQSASVFQKYLFADLNNREAAHALADQGDRASNCIELRFGLEARRKFVLDLEKFTANTKERFLAYMKFNHVLSGQVFSMQDPEENDCDK